MTEPLATVIIPCYNEQKSISRTVESVLRQRSSEGRPVGEWAEILVIDNASTDGTQDILSEMQRQHTELTLVFNEKNLGLAGSLNKAFRMARSAFVLICQADCRPLGDDYLSRMLQHFDEPKVAGVTGKPAVTDYQSLSFAERANLLLNQMDVEPEPPLVRDINFTEGRCDGFRKQALVDAGLYCEQTRVTGEDQIISMELRKHGYRLLQDTGLLYELSCGNSQNTVRRVIRHQVLLGCGQAFVLIRGGWDTSNKASTSPNRRCRKRLRLYQITILPVVFIALAAMGVFSPRWFAWCLVTLIVARSLHLLTHQKRRGSPTGDLWKMLPVALACDLTYCGAFYYGVWRSYVHKTL